MHVGAAWESFSPASQLLFAGNAVSFPPNHLRLLRGILPVLLHPPGLALQIHPPAVTQKVPKPSSSQLKPSAPGWFNEEGAASPGCNWERGEGMESPQCYLWEEPGDVTVFATQVP